MPLRMLFFSGVVFVGLLLLHLVNLVISAIGEIVESIRTPYYAERARRQLDRRFAKGKLSLGNYQRRHQELEELRIDV